MKGQAKKSPEVALLHERLEGKIRMIGLTGGIASGKSTVARFFKEAKIPLIDADEIAREVVRPGEKAYREIVQSFGEGILKEDRTLDRENLGRIVFGDESKRSLLESITHPEIFKEINKRVQALKKRKAKAAVVDAALLFESGLHRHMHKNILVRVDPEVQLRRLMKRDSLSEIQAWQRVLSQMPTPEKEKFADFVIDNSGSPEETRRQVLEILRKLT
jgi:dephospho-CoA kinase